MQDSRERAALSDPLRQQQTIILRWLLIAIIGLTTLTLVASNLLLDTQATLNSYVPIGLVLVTLCGSLYLLERGRFSAAVLIAAAAMLFRLGLIFVRSGAMGTEAYLMTFFIPIALVGLLLGRAALVTVSLLSVSIIAGVTYLEVQGSPLIGSETREVTPGGLALFFVFVVALFGFFLDRFGLSFRAALRQSALRQSELETLNEALQREVQERLTAEAALYRSEARLRLALEASNMGTWLWEPDKDESTWSANAKTLFGLSEDAPISGTTFYERVHPDDRAAIEAQVETALTHKSGFDLEFRLHPDLKPDRWLAGRGSVSLRPDGSIDQLLGVMYDISARKQAEGERLTLLQNEQNARIEAEAASRRLAFLAEASHLLSASLEYTQTLGQIARIAVPAIADWCAIDLCNDAGELVRLTLVHRDPSKVRWAEELQRRYPPDPTLDTGSYGVIRARKAAFYPELSPELLAQLAQDETHLELLTQIGMQSAIVVPLLLREQTLGTLTLVHAESGRRYTQADLQLAEELAQRVAVAVDNAKLYREAQELNATLEERVGERTRQLEESNHELEAFSYSVSHDLRSPLRGIDGFSIALQEDYAEAFDETAKGYLERIRAGTQRMGEIIDALLNLARISRSQIQRQTVDLSALAETVVNGLRTHQPERQVEVSIAPELSVEGDASLLRVLLENLLGNAWKFTRAQEGAQISLGLEETPEGRIYFVRDNGVGFNMLYANKLFAAFQRLHTLEEFEGTGIGLATVARIVQKHGGRVWAEGTPGEGATFYFSLAEASMQEAAA